ncbi:uncharacterized protein LOC121265683 [Juglans microcarpa x Juglans regia]|uniref:uncharacterized protein LOC121265683 n=1 Tax=Juglans microcarpa x Juglans regia TaxID=2249226 RepID=UPI001B7EB5C1|nr:uncharacterized protein LOC121265683 [Juglans microcarpa x Juglans regia]
MAVTEGHQAILVVAPRLRSYADLVLETPQPIPEVMVPFRSHKIVDGEVCIIFSKDEVDRSAIPFQYSLVLKFLRQRPSLDSIRAFIKARWGLSNQPIVSSMSKPVFVRLALEEDFVKAFARENCEINGVPYRVFHWTTEFQEDQEPIRVPVWITLPGLPPNYYHESFLRSITAPIGRFLKRDNPTRCATRTDGARICLEMDISKEPIQALWIGTPRNPQSLYQSIEFETLPAYCPKCHVQGHNSKTCKGEGKKRNVQMTEPKEKATMEQVWVIKETKGGNLVQKGESSKVEERQLNVEDFIPNDQVWEKSDADRMNGVEDRGMEAVPILEQEEADGEPGSTIQVPINPVID